MTFLQIYCEGSGEIIFRISQHLVRLWARRVQWLFIDLQWTMTRFYAPYRTTHGVLRMRWNRTQLAQFNDSPSTQFFILFQL